MTKDQMLAEYQRRDYELIRCLREQVNSLNGERYRLIMDATNARRNNRRVCKENDVLRKQIQELRENVY